MASTLDTINCTGVVYIPIPQRIQVCVHGLDCLIRTKKSFGEDAVCNRGNASISHARPFECCPKSVLGALSPFLEPFMGIYRQGLTKSAHT